jgi:hypothetical protein
LDYNGVVPSIRVGVWRLWVIPGDHEPRHVHAKLGSGSERQAIFVFTKDRKVALREVRGRLSRAEVRRAQEAVIDHFDDLVALWEEYC